MANRTQKPVTATKILLDISKAASLFVDQEGIAYLDVRDKGYLETWPVNSDETRDWLSNGYYSKIKDSPSAKAIESVIGTLQAKARHENNRREVFARIGYKDGKLYVDSCNEKRDIWEISKSGWQATKNPPIRFIKSRGALPLPTPKHGCSIDLLWKHINATDLNDRILIIGWLLGTLQSKGPRCILLITGEKGSGKSSASRKLRSIIDPNTMPILTLPANEEDLLITASNTAILAFDNISRCKEWHADGFCRLATGGGMSKRKKYTNGDEFRIHACKPVILNGIKKPINRDDLDSRSIHISLSSIGDESRQTEGLIDSEFAKDHAAILGALFDAAVVGLQRIGKMPPRSWPRMADFSEWVTACEVHFWQDGIFLSAYNKRNLSNSKLPDKEEAIFSTVLALMDQRNFWEGTITSLTQVRICQEAAPATLNWASIPPNRLSAALNSMTEELNAEGITLKRLKVGSAGERRIRLSRDDSQRISDGSDDQNTNTFSSSDPNEKKEKYQTLSSDRQRGVH